MLRDEGDPGSAREQGAWLEGLIQGLGHDLKAPLANIRGFADLLIAGGLTPEQSAHFLARIRWNTEVMGRLVADLLDLMRIGVKEEPLREVDAGAAALEALRELEPRIAERAAAVEVAPGMPTVRYPGGRLREVFARLVGNALEHAGETAGLRIGISHARAGAFHVFRVGDNGPGIDPAEQARIFEPFYSRTKKKTGSSGLGLAIVRRIVEQTGGCVAVESAPGAGAAFVFTVPA